ncbi:hypothetical protein ACLB2K_009218 [Fragaria x ananassa]
MNQTRRSQGVMGVVKDGTISGFLPSTQAFGVHYPGYPSSMSRAIDTLGGTQAIHKAHSSASNNNRLELRFRHDDPYSHPAFGDLRPCNSFLLKISKSKSETDQVDLCADIVAHVPEAYHFDGMADYQHVIAVHADVARNRKRNRVETEEPHSDRGGLMDIDQEDVMILLPQLFAPKDIPDNLVLRPSGTLSVKKNQEEPVQHQLEMDMEPVLAIDFGISEIPKRTNWEEYIPQDSDQWESQMAVSSLFDERPVWPKDSVTERLLNKGFIFSDHMLRRYQKIDYRVKPPLHGYCEANSANQLKHKWSDLCAFRVFPYKCHTTLQLFELDDDYIQQQIRKAPAQTMCSPETGWFSYNLLENLKYRIQVRFLSVYPKPGAERLLKAATESFRKSKKICNKDNLVRDEMVQQQTNAELTGDVAAEEPNNVEDDEEDDIEVDNGEETLDTYGGHDLVEDGEISLQPHSYLNMDNISRTHLQELFGSFPSPEARGDRIQDAYTSDEEYQIYEQDSDGNFSDEN